MQKAILDRMLWLPRIDPRVPKLRKDLVVITHPFRGAPQRIKLFEDRVDQFGVPRNWGVRQKWLTDEYQILDETMFPKIAWSSFTGTYRPGQQGAVEASVGVFLLRHGALLDAPAGSGKTLMCLDIASRLHTRTLILVHKDDLAQQWHKTAELFPGVEGGHVQEDKWDYEGKHFVTAMAQTLYSRQGREPKDFYKQFGLVVYDEGHRYPARTFEAVMRLPYARHRLGCSATWRRRDGAQCIWNWHVGQIEHRMNAVRMVGQYVQVSWNTRVKDSMFRQYKKINNAKYLSAISQSAPYNEWLAEQLLAGVAAGRQVLLCSHRTAQLHDIRQRILRSGRPATVGYYAGEVNGQKITREQLEVTKTCQIVLATYQKMAEGTDIPTLDTLYLATPATDVEQVVGRIQRIDPNKKPLLVVDPVWQTPYNSRLAAKRLRVYRKLGFTRQISERSEI
jgi:superfamily II DNA or RNA helicase